MAFWNFVLRQKKLQGVLFFKDMFLFFFSCSSKNCDVSIEPSKNALKTHPTPPPLAIKSMSQLGLIAYNESCIKSLGLLQSFVVVYDLCKQNCKQFKMSHQIGPELGG